LCSLPLEVFIGRLWASSPCRSNRLTGVPISREPSCRTPQLTSSQAAPNFLSALAPPRGRRARISFDCRNSSSRVELSNWPTVNLPESFHSAWPSLRKDRVSSTARMSPFTSFVQSSPRRAPAGSPTGACCDVTDPTMPAVRSARSPSLRALTTCHISPAPAAPAMAAHRAMRAALVAR